LTVAGVALVVVGLPLGVEVGRVDRLLVDHLVQLGAQVLHPVGPLAAGAVQPHRFDVDHACDVARAAAVLVPADDPAAVVEDEAPAAEGVDRPLALGPQEVRAGVRGDDVEVVVERARLALDLEELVARRGVRIARAVDDLGAVHRQRAGVLGIGALVGHHHGEPADRGVDDREERLQAAPVELDPAIEDVVRADRVLDREQRRGLVVLEDDLALRVEDEADVEEHAREVRVLRLGLRDEVDVELARDLAEHVGLGAGDVDGRVGRELRVGRVEDLVGEALERPLGDRDVAHRIVEARQPRRRLHDPVDVLDVARDVGASARAPHGRDQPDRHVRLDDRHGRRASRRARSAVKRRTRRRTPGIRLICVHRGSTSAKPSSDDSHLTRSHPVWLA
jgi:hypothetical protein